MVTFVANCFYSIKKEKFPEKVADFAFFGKRPAGQISGLRTKNRTDERLQRAPFRPGLYHTPGAKTTDKEACPPSSRPSAQPRQASASGRRPGPRGPYPDARAYGLRLRRADSIRLLRRLLLFVPASKLVKAPEKPRDGFVGLCAFGPLALPGAKRNKRKDENEPIRKAIHAKTSNQA